MASFLLSCIVKLMNTETKVAYNPRETSESKNTSKDFVFPVTPLVTLAISISNNPKQKHLIPCNYVWNK
jgi:hypothetical protein